MHACTSLHPNPGFTLIELITVVAVIAVTLAIGVPGYAGFTAQNRQIAVQNTFATVLAQARYQAISNNMQVVVCPSTDQKTCTGGYQWEKGYLSFVDDNQNRQVDSDETYLSVIQSNGPQIQIQTSKSRQKIVFQPSGMAYGSNTSVRFCNNQGVPASAIIISNTGRTRSSKTAANGSVISCKK